MIQRTVFLLPLLALVGCTAVSETSEPVFQSPIVATAETVTLQTLFSKAVRLAPQQSGSAAHYVLFSEDEKLAYVFSNNGAKREVLERRTLASGGFAWNQLDDATKNLRKLDGIWTIDQRMKRIGLQERSDVDPELGPWRQVHFSGVIPAASCPGIRYDVMVRHREHSGDGRFYLVRTYLQAENGRDVSFESLGVRRTERGTADDPDAVVWILAGDDGRTERFRYDVRAGTLTLLGQGLKRIDSSMNYTLQKVAEP